MNNDIRVLIRQRIGIVKDALKYIIEEKEKAEKKDDYALHDYFSAKISCLKIEIYNLEIILKYGR